MKRTLFVFALLIYTACFVRSVAAAVLPEEAVDLLYHRYEESEQVIDGPAVLVRKNFDSRFSLSAGYLLDTVSGASIDVRATASPYSETRTEVNLGLDYLYNKSILSFGYTNSDENDFLANAVHFNVSQDFFGDLTTLRLGYSQASDEIGERGSDVVRDADRRRYRIGFSQVVTKNSLFNLDYELITDEGFLNNPYRQYRFLTDEFARGYDYRKEVYPNTRTSNAVALRGLYYLPYRAALKGEYRYFSDSWGIAAHTVDLGYTHPIGDHVILDLKYRFYSQSKADFYADIFPFAASQTFLARDKEMSTFTTQTVGGGFTFEFGKGILPFIEKGSLNLLVDYVRLDYDDFRDVTAEGFAPGLEPLYQFSAVVGRLFATFNY